MRIFCRNRIQYFIIITFIIELSFTFNIILIKMIIYFYIIFIYSVIIFCFINIYNLNVKPICIILTYEILIIRILIKFN
jgi:hypothetical protein